MGETHTVKHSDAVNRGVSKGFQYMCCRTKKRWRRFPCGPCEGGLQRAPQEKKAFLLKGELIDPCGAADERHVGEEDVDTGV